ncbi:MAG: NAD(P)H-hydrate dehydratase [Clostridia bacterium]|nr:NAD(P)H-hydrate dehydratase [Clostridia bacterium]
MQLVTAEEMRRLDQTASSDFHIPSIVLMENAGRQLAEAVKRCLGGRVVGRHVVVFSGKGNNGGDGLVAARHLINWGAEVKVFLLTRGQDLRGDAATNFSALSSMGAKIYEITGDRELQKVQVALMRAEIVIDAIYGTGFRGQAAGLTGQTIQMINEFAKPVIAADLPSGLEADTGKVYGPCIRAQETVTFALPKLGLYLEPGASYAGRITVADISIPASLLGREDIGRQLLTWEWCRRRVKRREVSGHKGTYGHVLVVGGSEGMTGAVVMAGEAALRAGAGMTTAAVPAPLHPILEIKTTEVLTRPLPETPSRGISEQALETILAMASKMSVLAVGPGLGRDPSSQALVRGLVGRAQLPLVIDADGLNALVGHTDVLRQAKMPPVLTPHPGEMARLWGSTTDKVQSNRLEIAENAARAWNAIVVLKGAKTIVAVPGGPTYINPTGNPGMGTAGSGDVLTGAIAAFIAQGLAPAEAACLGVFVHGAAGDLMAGRLGQRGLVAGDLMMGVAEILKQLEGEEVAATGLGGN